MNIRNVTIGTTLRGWCNSKLVVTGIDRSNSQQKTPNMIRYYLPAIESEPIGISDRVIITDQRGELFHNSTAITLA